ncbi:glycosyltransferase family 2 protein [Cellvibrio fontiphilus]|uniref:Glycosyltransferase family 2 protein n=1 Tax=Cellvibrio fontiphilus TaxID=1815559 RepID=A0ABV7FBR3_9GAMM
MNSMSVSLVILTYKRKPLLLSLMDSYWSLRDVLKEIIIVDNDSGEGLKSEIEDRYPSVSVIELQENVGTQGRNVGISRATADIVILLDDDVFDLSIDEVGRVVSAFEKNKELAALCFKVVHADSSELINWCHHKPKEFFANKSFETYEITEGAVAVRRDAFLAVGGFPGHFFISHEGPDLALRLMDAGYSIWYSPDIVVKHHQSTLGRPSWRRYYYDTRNVIWLSARNYPLLRAIRFLFVQLGAMLVYSARDGYLKYYFKAIFNALKGLKQELKERKVISNNTQQRLKLLSAEDESFYVKAKRRFLKSGVGI